MKKQKFPPGWDEKRIKELIAHYEGQTEDEEFADIEAAREAEDVTLMAIPTELVPEVRALLARKQIVETLQANRTEAVHLLDQLVRQLPDGLYLRSVRQSGAKVTLIGYAQSNARVSTLMRNIESSPWLGNPELVEIKSVPLDRQKVNEFTLNLQVKRPTEATEPGKGPPGAPAAKKGPTA